MLPLIRDSKISWQPPETMATSSSDDIQLTESGESRGTIHEGPTRTVPSNSAHVTDLALVGAYVRTIMDPDDSMFPRLKCPRPELDRYAYLVHSRVPTGQSHSLRYIFALNLHRCVDLLLRLIGSIIETIRYLGPHNCALSIVEGRSDDGTFEVLNALRSSMELLGARYYFHSSDIDPAAKGNDRIKSLAALRNLAVQDLVAHPEHYYQDATVLFSNDVSLCMEDILELIHQRKLQRADQTCAMDWTYVGEDPTFYDIWMLVVWRVICSSTFLKAEVGIMLEICFGTILKPVRDGLVAARSRYLPAGMA